MPSFPLTRATAAGTNGRSATEDGHGSFRELLGREVGGDILMVVESLAGWHMSLGVSFWLYM